MFWTSEFRRCLGETSLRDYLSYEFARQRLSKRFIAYYQVYGRELGMSSKDAAESAAREFASEEAKITEIAERESELLSSMVLDASLRYTTDQNLIPRPNELFDLGFEGLRHELDLGDEASKESALVGKARDPLNDFYLIRDRQAPPEARRLWRRLREEFTYITTVAQDARLQLGEAAYWAGALSGFQLVEFGSRGRRGILRRAKIPKEDRVLNVIKGLEADE